MFVYEQSYFRLWNCVPAEISILGNACMLQSPVTLDLGVFI